MKDVERKLCNVWICSKSGELCLDRNYRYYSIACALKQRMLNFVQNLLNYMTFEVFESSWITFEEKLKDVSNIDDVISYHGSFLDSCLRDCIIQSRSFLNIQKITHTFSSTFPDFIRIVCLPFPTDFCVACLELLALMFTSNLFLNKIILNHLSFSLSSITYGILHATARQV